MLANNNNNRLLSCILLFVFFSTYIADAKSVSQYTSRNIRSEQWRYYLRQVRNYSGLVVRIGGDGIAQQWSDFTFTYTTPSTIQQRIDLTVEYKNISFVNGGNPIQKLAYINNKNNQLPDFGLRINEDGQVEPPSSVANDTIIQFYPKAFGFFSTVSIKNKPFYAIEKFVIHPFNKNIKISILPIYLQNQFLRITFYREYLDMESKKFFRLNLNAKVLDNNYKSNTLFGLWSGIKRCVHPLTYNFTRSISVEMNPSFNFPVQNRILWELTDKLVVSFPKSISYDDSQKKITFNAQWKLDFRTVLVSESVFDENGLFESDCTTVYYRMF